MVAQEKKQTDKESGLLADLNAHENLKSQPRLTAVFAATAVLGLVFGTLGGAYLAPWYQKNVLKQNPGVATVENRKIILDEESAIVSAVAAVNPAVVSIVVTKDLPKFERFGFPFDEFFFDTPSPSGETEKRQVGAGSGFIVTADGMIVTNKHVAFDASAEYTVITKDGAKYPAKVLATDPFNDLAVIKIDAQDLRVVVLGDSDSLKLGQRVIAIGNALGEFRNTVTTGVVSGIGRTITAGGGAQTERLSEVIKTDAAINP